MREEAVKAKALQVQCAMKAVEMTLKPVEKSTEKVAKEVAKVEKEATRKWEKERKAVEKALEKAANENSKAKQKHTLKKTNIEKQSLNSTNDLTVKIKKNEKKTKQDSGTCDAICDTYNAQPTPTATGSSEDTIEMINDSLVAGGSGRKVNEKGKAGEPIKSTDISEHILSARHV